MKKNQIILIIIGVLVLIGFVSSFSYWLGQKSTEVRSEITTQNLLESKVIQNWSATAMGRVINKGENNIIIESNGENLLLPVNSKTIIKKALLEKDEKKIEEVDFEDIKIGDEVNIEIRVEQTGDIWAISVTILPK